MLKRRIIPTLLWKNSGLVKGVKFDHSRKVGTILPAIKVYNTRCVDELIVVDVEASIKKREPDYSWVSDFSAECFVPLTVGGGVASVENVRELLRAGADKVCINSACYDNPEIITEIASQFGKQCVVVSIDVRSIRDNDYECYSHSGTKPTGYRVSDWVKRVEMLGAGEILLTSIDRDGTLTGFDIELLKKVSRPLKIPLIASGGAGNYQHMLEALTEGNASAVSAASVFHFTEQTPMEAKQFLAEKGVPVRLLPQPYTWRE